MSNKGSLRDRGTKALLRRLEYLTVKPLLWARAEVIRARVKEDRRLNIFERVRFKRWLFWKQGGAYCAYCGLVIPLEYLTIDHIHPKSKGGAVRDISNMTLACLGCNRDKDNKWYW